MTRKTTDDLEASCAANTGVITPELQAQLAVALASANSIQIDTERGPMGLRDYVHELEAEARAAGRWPGGKRS